MVSDEPKPGRCAADITDKVGLDVHDDELDVQWTTGNDEYDTIVQVELVRGAVTAQKEPEYLDVVDYLREGFTLTRVELRPSEASDDADTTWIEVADDDPYVTNHGTDHVGFCERWPVKSNDSERCPMHGGLTPDEDTAPEDNLRAMTHGLHAKRSSYYEQMDDEEKVLVEEFVDDWLELSTYDRDNTSVVNELYRIAVDQIRLWNAQDEFEKGIVYEQYEDIDPESGRVETDQENPANLPYDRLDRTTFRKLKDLGVLDDPESQQAEATESLAEKFANVGND